MNLDLEERVARRTAELEAAAAQLRESEESLQRLLEQETAARAEAEAARVEAQAANRAKDEFLAVLSHELRSPLGTILTWVTLLRSGRVDPAREERGLAAIERNARLQGKLIEDLLDVSRIISGKTVLEISLIEIGPTIEAAMESMRAAAEAKDIQMTAQIDAGVGPLLADPTRIQQLIWNLLSNSVKFTPRGGSVRVDVGTTNSQVLIRVTDTGRGISSQFLPHVFERFRQADASTTRAEGGLGLGLAIVRHIAELHGGSVSADSPGEGLGATFSVLLPLPAVRVVTARTIAHERLRVASISLDRLDGLRVLVVDDEIDAREAIAAVLEECGARVVQAESVATGIEALRGEPFHVVVSDIGMPGQDGYAFIRRLREFDRERNRKTPAFALTAYATTAETQRILAEGFDVSLTKPVEARELIGEISRFAGASPDVPAPPR
jgi:signal transduction histidine kinase/ActR/RegA family two-component response regulator